MMVALGFISAMGTPRLYGRTEYTIIGSGGVLGAVSTMTFSVAAQVTNSGVLVTALPEGSGESFAALAAVGLPLTYVFYKLFRTDTTPIGAQQNGSTLDPDIVREKTEHWSDREAATPARKQQNTTQRIDTPSNTNQPDTTDADPSENGTVSDNASASASKFCDMEYRWEPETDVSFADVGGMEGLKHELERDVIRPLTTHREKAAELGVSAPNIIFHGPPGTGKTFIAKALATELGLPFAKSSGADLQSKWINESATKVQTLFEEAKTVAAQEGGAVVFLDELDTVLKNRDGDGNAHEEDNKVVNEFLNHLENTEDHNVVFVGATNRLESLDDAGIRSGRIDKKVHVGKPDGDARAAVLKAQLADRPHQLDSDDMKRAASMTDGLVAADLELVVTIAARYVLDRNGEKIRNQDLKRGISDLSVS
ncbi:ATP-binding protein [Natronomonas sp. F2-12]|uniref:ATP-binding protein n=1 Tax=Natronomonas aquatica TaxID=2841590 RepID=A0A9R1CVM9_9EURY|nr:ATP-binding protein [Natronomonas aquatica]MCQ4335010.1 ATP-binding protein [Natronomonas aquatica]